MRKKNLFFMCFGLILLALYSCDKSIQSETATDATTAKVKKRTTMRTQPSELGNFFVNPALDDEYLLSEAEIVEELMSWGFLNANESVNITPISYERVIPLFFKSLIVEPESNEWYGINANEMMNTYFEFPSIAFYIINSESGKSFFTTANKLYASNLIEYRCPNYIDPEVVTIQEDIINELYDAGESVYQHTVDSLWRARLYEILGINPFEDNTKFTLCEWKLRVCDHITTAVPCWSNDDAVSRGPLLTESLRWSQSSILLGCNHDLVAGSIALSILKILCLSEYNGIVLDDYFNGLSYRSSLLVLQNMGRHLYDDIVSAAPNYAERGIEILSSCGFTITDPTAVNMSFVLLQIRLGKVVIVENENGSWSLLDGYKEKEGTCGMIYLYDYDKNNCEQSQYDWSDDKPQKVYCYEENEN